MIVELEYGCQGSHCDFKCIQEHMQGLSYFILYNGNVRQGVQIVTLARIGSWSLALSLF